MVEVDPRYLIIQPAVPKPDSPGAEKLREVLDTGADYQEVGFTTVENAAPMDCFLNVEKAIEQGGGCIVYGWQIWESLPGVMMEAEFHAVWLEPGGDMKDVTPHLFDGIEKILFLPDPNRIYVGKQVDNLRISLVEDKLVEQFLKNARRRFKVLNADELAYQHGLIAASREMEQIDRRFRRLEAQIKQKYYVDTSK